MIFLVRDSTRDWSSISNLFLKKALTWKDVSALPIYPTGSNARRLYGREKAHKVPENETINDLPMKSIVSNIGMTL